MAQNLQRRAMAPAWSIGITIPARAILHLIVVVAMLALFAGHARAGVLGDIGGFFGDVKDWVTGEDSVPGIPSNAACDEYADEAMFNARRNVNLQCGFFGGRYTEDRDAHFKWCKRQITRGQHRLGEAAENEQRARDEEINRCNRCNVYGDNANIAAKRNVLFHCGGTGNRWGSGDGHKAWCMGVRASTADAETRARDEVVSQCNARYTPAQLRQCDAYAHKAAKQAEFNSQNNCRGTGPRWTQDRDAHFAWCTWGWENDIGGTNVVTAMAQERDARDAENESCQNAAQARMSRINPNQLQRFMTPGAGAFAAPEPSAIPMLNRDNLAAAPRIPRQRPAVVPVAPREPILAAPVATGETGRVSTVRPVLVPALPAGTISAPPLVRIEGTIPAWKLKLPLDVFKPKEPTPGTGGWYPSKPYPPTPSTPPAPGGTGGVNQPKPIPPVPSTPPAPGGTGGINQPKPIPPTPSTPPTPGGTGGVNQPKPIPVPTPNGSSDLYLKSLKNRPLPADLFKPKGSSGLPPVKSYGTKADSPVAWKHRPIRPAISRPTASTGALPIRSNATAGSVATKTPIVLQRRPVASSGSAFARRAPTIRAPSAGMARARPALVR